MAQPVVEFKRTLKPGVEDGTDIRAVKIVVSRLGCWPWMQFDNKWHTGKGTFSAEGIPCIRKQLGLTFGNMYIKAIHEATLAKKVTKGPHKGEWAWSQTAINLYSGYQDMSAAEKIVVDMIKEWRCMEAHAAAWHYSQRRPNDYSSACDAGGYADCSGTVLRCAKRAGSKPIDPIWGWSGPGNTDSLRHGGFAIPLGDVDKYCKDHVVCAFFGPSWDETDHVIVAENSSLWHSDGNENAPEIWPTVHHDSFLNLLGCRAYPVI